jgi:hypothetical protein
MRRSPAWRTLRALFSRSANVCAFPGCAHELVNEDDLFVAEVCHIRAAAPGGPRYSAKQNDDERRRAANLMLLCHAHHVVIDSDVRRFSVRSLQRIKLRHERLHRVHHFRPSDSVLSAAQEDIERYWARIALLNRAHVVSGVPAIRLDVRRDSDALYRLARRSLDRLADAASGVAASASRIPEDVRAFLVRIGTSTRRWDKVPYFDNPTHKWRWEVLNIGMPNWLLEIRIAILQLELLDRERQRPAPGSLADRRLKQLRRELESVARHGVYVD